MIRKLSIIALILLLIGIGGSILTGKSNFKQAERLEEKVIDDNHYINLDIYTDHAKVILLPTDDKKAKVELVGNDKRYELKTDVQNDTLKIEMKSNRSKLFSFNLFSIQSTLTIQVPQKTYDNIQVKSNNGRIDFSDIEGSEIRIDSDNGRIHSSYIKGEDIFYKSNNGRIELENVVAKSIKSEANNGRIELENVVANLVRSEAANGSITMENIDGEIIGKSRNGKIQLMMKELNRPIDLFSNNGRIEVQTDERPTNATLDLKSNNGSITVFGEEDWDTVIGNGDHLIKLKTNNGKITISH